MEPWSSGGAASALSSRDTSPVLMSPIYITLHSSVLTYMKFGFFFFFEVGSIAITSKSVVVWVKGHSGHTHPVLHSGADVPWRPASAHGEEHQAGHAVHQSKSVPLPHSFPGRTHTHTPCNRGPHRPAPSIHLLRIIHSPIWAPWFSVHYFEPRPL